MCKRSEPFFFSAVSRLHVQKEQRCLAKKFFFWLNVCFFFFLIVAAAVAACHKFHAVHVQLYVPNPPGLEWQVFPFNVSRLTIKSLDYPAVLKPYISLWSRNILTADKFVLTSVMALNLFNNHDCICTVHVVRSLNF